MMPKRQRNNKDPEFRREFGLEIWKPWRKTRKFWMKSREDGGDLSSKEQ